MFLYACTQQACEIQGLRRHDWRVTLCTGFPGLAGCGSARKACQEILGSSDWGTVRAVGANPVLAMGLKGGKPPPEASIVISIQLRQVDVSRQTLEF